MSHVVGSDRLRRGPELATALLLVAGALAPASDRLADAQILAHHAQHFVLVAAGGLLGAAWVRPRLGPAAAPAAALAAVAVAVWHVPAVFDAAASDPRLHAAGHLGFLLAGMLLGLAGRELGGLARGLLLGALMAAMPLWSFACLAGLYTSFPESQQAVAGSVMFLVDAGAWFVYLLWPRIRPLLRDWRLTAALATVTLAVQLASVA